MNKEFLFLFNHVIRVTMICNQKSLFLHVSCGSLESAPPKQPYVYSLVEPKNDPSVSKVVQQLGFVVLPFLNQEIPT